MKQASAPRRQSAIIYACMIGVLLGLGCNSEHEVNQIGEGYGLETHGGGLSHEAYIVSLVRTNNSGTWTTVWHAVSFRCQGPTVWNKSVVFGGVTDQRQAEQGRVRLLFFSEQTGVVDITGSVAARAGVLNGVSATFIRLNRVGLDVDVKVEGDKAFETRVSLADLQAIAHSVVERNNRRTFDGIVIME